MPMEIRLTPHMPGTEPTHSRRQGVAVLIGAVVLYVILTGGWGQRVNALTLGKGYLVLGLMLVIGIYLTFRDRPE